MHVVCASARVGSLTGVYFPPNRRRSVVFSGFIPTNKQKTNIVLGSAGWLIGFSPLKKGTKKESRSLLHLECHCFNLKSQHKYQNGSIFLILPTNHNKVKVIARLARGGIREHEAFLGHEMRVPAGTGCGGVSMDGKL